MTSLHWQAGLRNRKCHALLFIYSSFSQFYKVDRNGNFVFKGFNNSKKRVTSSGVRPDATDYYWVRSPVPNQMS